MAQSALITRPAASQSDLITRPNAVGEGGGGEGGDTILDAGSAQNISFLSGGATLVWTNQPTAETEFNGAINRRVIADLGGRATIQAYASGTVPSGPAATLAVKYSIDNGASWLHFGSGCFVTIDNLGAAVQTAFGVAVAIPAGAQGDVLLSVFGVGDATPTEDPAFILIGALVR